MEDLEKMSSPDLVAFAISKGFKTREIRGKSRSELIDFMKKYLPSEENVVSQVSDKVVRTWQELKKLAKEKGINTYKKKRSEIEILLKGQNNG